MKDYYKILGLEEGVSLEEITGRWMELKRQFQSAPEKGDENDEIIREINEAYRVLKSSVPPSFEFDLEKYLKRSSLSERTERQVKTQRENPLKDYYKILGLEEGVSLEEITARWTELKRQFQSAPEKGGENDEIIREINEAYRVLKSSVPPSFEFDIEDYLRKSVLSRRVERDKIEGKRKKIVLSSAILAIVLILAASIFFLKRPQVTIQPTSTTREEPKRKIQGSVEETASLDPKIPARIAQVAPQEPKKALIPEPDKAIPKEIGTVEAAKPIPKEPPAASTTPVPPSLKTAPPVEVAKVVPREQSKTAIPESPKPAPATKPALKAAPPVTVAKVVPQEPGKRTIPNSAKAAPTTTPSLKIAPRAEVAKGVPQEQSKTVTPENAKPVPKEVERAETAKTISTEPPAASITPSPAMKTALPVEVEKAVPQEPSKAVIPESAKAAPKEVERVEPAQPAPQAPPAPSITPPLPAMKTAPPAEVAKVIPQEPRKTALPESAKIALPAPPSAIATDREVRQFFESYVNRYNRKEIGGFISFFSPKAIQNQKDDLEKIRKTYNTFFDQMETVRYQIAINKIEAQQKSVEVKAQYELEGIVIKGRKKQTWKGQIRWVLVRENGELKIVSLDYQTQAGK